MRLAGHEQVIVLEDDGLGEGNYRLYCNLTPIKKPFPHTVLRIRGYGSSVCLENLSHRYARGPHLRLDAGETLDKKIQDGRTRAGAVRQGDFRVLARYHGSFFYMIVIPEYLYRGSTIRWHGIWISDQEAPRE
jgi:hypothetical protein